MIYFLYPFLALMSLPITLIGVLTSPILPLFAKDLVGLSDNGSMVLIEPRLPAWLGWFMTPDNSLLGDRTFQEINGEGYLSKVKWLLRNPAYSFALKYMNGYSPVYWSGDKTIKDNDNAKAGWCFIRAGGLFQFTAIYPIGYSRCARVTLGWNIAALADDNVPIKPNPYQATFAFSPRLSGFR